MVDRRQVLIGLGTAGAVSLAGCMDLLQDGVEEEASLATVEESVVDEAGYSYAGAESYVIDETFEIAGESRDVHVTSWVTTYAKEVDDLELPSQENASQVEGDVEDAIDQDAAGYAVISTPSKAIAGQEVNPVGRMDNEELIDEFNQEITSGEVSEISNVGEHTVESLGEDTAATEFEAAVELEDGTTYDVTAYVTEVTNESDIILGVGVFPAGAAEQDNVLSLTEAIQHPVENPPD